MLIEDLIGSLGYLGSAVGEVIEEFFILGDLRDNEEDVLAWFFLHLEVETFA